MVESDKRTSFQLERLCNLIISCCHLLFVSQLVVSPDVQRIGGDILPEFQDMSSEGIGDIRCGSLSVQDDRLSEEWREEDGIHWQSFTRVL